MTNLIKVGWYCAATDETLRPEATWLASLPAQPLGQPRPRRNPWRSTR